MYNFSNNVRCGLFTDYVLIMHASTLTYIHTHVHTQTQTHTHFSTDAVKLPQATSLAMLLKVSTAQPPSQDLMSYSHWVEPAHSMSVS